MEILVAPKLKRYKKIGLALGGGGARGFALIGVLRAFEEENIEFDKIAGTSIGSVVGAMAAYGLNSYQMEELATKLKLNDIKKTLMVTRNKIVENANKDLILMYYNIGKKLIKNNGEHRL